MPMVKKTCVCTTSDASPGVMCRVMAKIEQAELPGA